MTVPLDTSYTFATTTLEVDDLDVRRRIASLGSSSSIGTGCRTRSQLSDLVPNTPRCCHITVLCTDVNMDPDLKLDKDNPPKYCPFCAKKGIKSKVRKFKLKAVSDEPTIMCKNEMCPWPFNIVPAPEAVGMQLTKVAEVSDKRKKKAHDSKLLNESKDKSEMPTSTESPSKKNLGMTGGEKGKKVNHEAFECPDKDKVGIPILSKNTKIDAENLDKPVGVTPLEKLTVLNESYFQPTMHSTMNPSQHSTRASKLFDNVLSDASSDSVDKSNEATVQPSNIEEFFKGGEIRPLAVNSPETVTSRPDDGIEVPNFQDVYSDLETDDVVVDLSTTKSEVVERNDSSCDTVGPDSAIILEAPTQQIIENSYDDENLAVPFTSVSPSEIFESLFDLSPEVGPSQEVNDNSQDPSQDSLLDDFFQDSLMNANAGLSKTDLSSIGSETEKFFGNNPGFDAVKESDCGDSICDTVENILKTNSSEEDKHFGSLSETPKTAENLIIEENSSDHPSNPHFLEFDKQNPDDNNMKNAQQSLGWKACNESFDKNEINLNSDSSFLVSNLNTSHGIYQSISVSEIENDTKTSRDFNPRDPRTRIVTDDGLILSPTPRIQTCHTSVESESESDSSRVNAAEVSPVEKSTDLEEEISRDCNAGHESFTLCKSILESILDSMETAENSTIKRKVTSRRRKVKRLVYCKRRRNRSTKDTFKIKTPTATEHDFDVSNILSGMKLRKVRVKVEKVKLSKDVVRRILKSKFNTSSPGTSKDLHEFDFDGMVKFQTKINSVVSEEIKNLKTSTKIVEEEESLENQILQIQSVELDHLTEVVEHPNEQSIERNEKYTKTNQCVPNDMNFNVLLEDQNSLGPKVETVTTSNESRKVKVISSNLSSKSNSLHSPSIVNHRRVNKNSRQEPNPNLSTDPSPSTQDDLATSSVHVNQEIDSFKADILQAVQKSLENSSEASLDTAHNLRGQFRCTSGIREVFIEEIDIVTLA